MSAQRMLFFTVAALLFAGIVLSGWDQVHWLLYLPAGMLVFAGLTGICPGLMLYRKLGFK
ncbi:MAG: DUF2892 domain-containing protein [Candidatus Thiodiazotropha sp. (ex Ctena orbiculata)]|nr:DUF2892 domain-containing protein [Candidatus Thiodiazotropha taylori]PUB84720.1 MAG: hypothetical protein DBP00_14090 [gamma proteobacterium symbiont of Ctena orbiculata]MBT2998319.1 DUF2892 domain-containing protein [Candidatus Thiodiazotropha taylori]MBT3002570.1 DUF2892 domain-containing protein [Candidatus Thiodiazotropha taylori]MBT3029259.1 DUF2892 domain-containing protein [Candidatus Thiodiazotropha taylori]